MTALPDNWTDDTPLTLEEACEAFFRDTIKPATLRAEAERGNLKLEKVGRRLFTTPAAIREMRKKCRVKSSPRVSSSEITEGPKSGLSKTENEMCAQAVLQQTLKELKQSSKRTSSKSTNQRRPKTRKLSLVPTS